MKCQLVILQLILFNCLLLTTYATDHQCEKLLRHCSQLKSQCSLDMIKPKSCCDLTNFPPSKVPSAVYKIVTNCSCQYSSFSIEQNEVVNAYCDMDTADGGWIVIQRNKKSGANFFYNKKWKDLETSKETRCGMD